MTSGIWLAIFYIIVKLQTLKIFTIWDIIIFFIIVIVGSFLEGFFGEFYKYLKRYYKKRNLAENDL